MNISKKTTRTMYRTSILLGILLLCGAAGKAQVSPFQGLGQAQFFDNSGAPLTNGVLYSFQAGTSTQQATYTDSTGTVQNVNPITFGTGARVQIWLTTSAFYKFVLCLQNDGAFCAAGDILFSVDNVPGGSSGGGGGGCGSTCTSIFISSTASPATSGALRLASGDSICWRNAAGSANLCFKKDSNDLLSWDGGSFKLPEVGAPAGVAGFDILWADNTLHRWKFVNNGGTADSFVGLATTDTFTNKTYDAQGSGNVFKIGGTQITNTGQSISTFLRGDGTWTNGETTASQSGLATTSSGNQLTTILTPSANSMYRVSVYAYPTTLSSGCTTNPVINAIVSWTDPQSGSVFTQAGVNVSSNLNIATATFASFMVYVKSGTALQGGVVVSPAGSGCATNAIVASQMEALP